VAGRLALSYLKKANPTASEAGVYPPVSTVNKILYMYFRRPLLLERLSLEQQAHNTQYTTSVARIRFYNSSYMPYAKVNGGALFVNLDAEALEPFAAVSGYLRCLVAVQNLSSFVIS
jgi:hypothetical protein